MVLKYRGVRGTCHYNREMNMFVGELNNTETLITFRGGSLNKAKKSFIDVTNKYLDSKNKLHKD